MKLKNNKDIANAIEKLTKEIDAVPKDRIVISISHGTYQYYRIRENSTIKEYIPKTETPFIKLLIQRDYNKRALNILQKFVTSNSHNLDSLNQSLVKLIDSTPLGRRKYIDPLIQSTADFVKNWEITHLSHQNNYPFTKKYDTNKKEIVRSKSEKFIADKLLEYNIPYSYEPKLMLGHAIKYPDFAILNVRTRQTFYWEHFGFTDSDEYAINNLHKLASYESNGYEIGKNLIVTFEADDCPIDLNLINRKICDFLL